MIKAGVGVSRNSDSWQAGYEATKKALYGLGADKAHLFVVFASIAFDQKKMIEGVRSAMDAPIVGCSGAGGISNAGPEQKSVVVMALYSNQILFTTGAGRDVRSGERRAGSLFAEEILKKAPKPLEAVLMFPDVLVGNGAETLRGVEDVLGEHFPIFGGAAGDDFLFQKTYEYCDGEVLSGGVSGVGLSGNFTIGTGVRHGWIPIGPPFMVTKSRGATIYEIDDKPAVSLYEDYFGHAAEELRKEPLAKMAITYPLGMKIPNLDEYFIRDPLTVGLDGSITCAAEIPEGSEVRLLIGSKERAIEAAEEAAHKLMKDFAYQNKKPACLFIFNCIAREKLYGPNSKDEINAVQDIVGRDVPLIGFYTYGEVAPLGGEVHDVSHRKSYFYNETIVLLGLGE